MEGASVCTLGYDGDRIEYFVGGEAGGWVGGVGGRLERIRELGTTHRSPGDGGGGGGGDMVERGDFRAEEYI